MASDQDKSKLFGEGLPGTGGDFIDPNDTEGHVRHNEQPDGGGPVELGTRGEDGLGRLRARFTDADEDTEGHLYRTGPTTTGEFAKRVPSDNPHGER